MTIADIERAREALNDHAYAVWVHRPAVVAALNAYAKLLALRETHKLLPIECTKEMHIAGHDAQCIAEAEYPERGTIISAIWEAMITAAKDPFENTGE